VLPGPSHSLPSPSFSCSYHPPIRALSAITLFPPSLIVMKRLFTASFAIIILPRDTILLSSSLPYPSPVWFPDTFVLNPCRFLSFLFFPHTIQFLAYANIPLTVLNQCPTPRQLMCEEFIITITRLRIEMFCRMCKCESLSLPPTFHTRFLSCPAFISSVNPRTLYIQKFTV
jgi:hypothetical protein